MELRNRLILVFTIILILFTGVLFTNIYPQSADEASQKLSIGGRTLNFLVISDWGRESINDTAKKAPGQLKVAKQFGITAREINASFVVTCGDNFHGKGVPSPTDPYWGVNFENVYTAKSLMIPWYITLGNHDYEGNVDAELEYAKTSNRWIEPARYYSFTKQLPDSTEALFVIVDSSPFIRDYINKTQDENHVKSQDTGLQLH
jgi:acid phosphatase